MPDRRHLRPRATPRQDRSRATFDAVVEAAAQVFERHGYAAGTTNRIAERAGVSIGTLYQYFPGKDAILVELVRRHLADGTARLLPVLAEVVAGPVPLQDGLRRLLRSLVALHESSPRLHRILFEEAPLPASVPAQLREQERHAVDALAGWLDALTEVDVADARLAARFVVTIGEALAHRLVIHPDPEVDPVAAEAEAVRLLALYLRGGTATGAAQAAAGTDAGAAGSRPNASASNS